jgi:hypothetical protein
MALGFLLLLLLVVVGLEFELRASQALGFFIILSNSLQ